MVDIPGYENEYAITEDGKIWSYKSKKWLHPYLDDHGYLRTELNQKGIRLHQLLAITFIENPENLPTVDHIDQNRLNNSLDNLRWASRKTQAENQRHACWEAWRKVIYQIDKKTKQIIKEWNSIIEAAKTLDIDPSSITKACLHKRKSAGGFIWEYKEE